MDYPTTREATVPDLPGIFTDWSPMTATALLGLVVVLILTDRLVTRRRLEEEQARTRKAEALADKSVTLVEKVSEQVTDLTAGMEKNAQTDDLAVVLLRSIRRHLGIEEEPQ